MKKNSVLSNALLWFGAAVSVAEIETGSLLHSFVGNDHKSLWLTIFAILAGHIAGGVLFFLCATISAKQQVNAMTAQRAHYGNNGARFFASANILQLIGWTAVMIAQGAAAANALVSTIPVSALCCVIGVMVAIWLYCGAGDAVRLNSAAVALLFLLVVVLTVKMIFQCVNGAGYTPAEDGQFSFWAAFELSACMPLSWLPLAGDYVKGAEKPIKASAVSAIVYTIGSTWMYMIGLCATLFLGAENTTAIFAGFGLFGIALAVVILSTVTTTFLDAWSAGESATTICGKLNPKWFSIGVTALGIILAIFGIMDRLMDFLYFIASVFAPMAIVQIFDYFCNRKQYRGRHIVNCIGWLVGFAAYHVCLKYNCPFGATFPAMLAAIVIPAIVNGCKRM